MMAVPIMRSSGSSSGPSTSSTMPSPSSSTGICTWMGGSLHMSSKERTVPSFFVPDLLGRNMRLAREAFRNLLLGLLPEAAAGFSEAPGSWPCCSDTGAEAVDGGESPLEACPSSASLTGPGPPPLLPSPPGADAPGTAAPSREGRSGPLLLGPRGEMLPLAPEGDSGRAAAARAAAPAGLGADCSGSGADCSGSVCLCL
mmetsp:Transcript_38814/g.123343  ORF Transcript_38814/g.123343 Transcript_38814/m.123343 type:complete len:200 (-) Transcript_38814:2341-2940(-)